MSESTGASEVGPTSGGARPLLGRLRRLVLKELRETLRDRRTILTLVVMPILIYPLLAIVFQRFLMTSLTAEQELEYIIGVESELEGEILARQIQAGSDELLRRSEASDEASREASETPLLRFVAVPMGELGRHVMVSVIHMAARQRRESDGSPDVGLHAPSRWELVYRAGSPTSEAALYFVESRLQAYNERELGEQLRRLGVAVALPAPTERRPVHFAGAPAFSLAALIPLILVLMTVTGAVYPAIDLTAGERERGTLETLIAAPVPRLGLLMAKYVAVLTVALLTALVNLAGMTITAHTTGLAAALFGGGMTLAVIVKVLLLLALFAAFFSAILLALTSMARSFKEAQAYIIPLMLVCLVPGVLCLIPGLEFTLWMAVTPLVNIVMLARDMLEGDVVTYLAVAAVCSTLFYVAAAIALAARIFGTDAILYGSQATWSDMLRRPPEPRPAASVPAAMLGLALMFALYVVLGAGLARSTELAMGQRLVILALLTALVFGGVPSMLAMAGRVRMSSGLGLQIVNVGTLVAAGLMGLVLWPIAHEIFLLSERLGLSVLGPEQVRAAEAMLAQWQELPLALILVALAVVPGVFEELCFRGFVFGALRRVLAADRTIVASACLFGVFHEVLLPGRFLASAFLGVVLGWVRVRSASVIPCMLLHVLHNGLLLTLSYYRDDLIARGWGVAEQVHLPASWIALSVLGTLAAFGLLVVATKANRDARGFAAESR
jgi:sodium transport system permease protein